MRKLQITSPFYGHVFDEKRAFARGSDEVEGFVGDQSYNYLPD